MFINQTVRQRNTKGLGAIKLHWLTLVKQNKLFLAVDINKNSMRSYFLF